MTSSISVNGSQILGVVPGILGFHPTDSIVVVGLITKPDGRLLVGPVARVDRGSALHDLGASLRRHVQAAIVITYSDDPRDAADTDTAALGLPVRAHLSAPNTPAPVDSRIAAENALTGRSTLRDRAALVASVAYRPSLVKGWPAAAFPTDVRSRDALIARELGRAAEAVPVLVSVLAATPGHHPAAANLAGALAILAYRAGDGGLAQVAIDRALAADPGNQLAALLIESIGLGLSPADLAKGLLG